MWKYVLNKMIKQKEAAFFIVMIILSFAVSSAAPYLNGKFIDLLTVSKDIHLIVQFALIIVGVGVVGALLSYCSTKQGRNFPESNRCHEICAQRNRT